VGADQLQKTAIEIEQQSRDAQVRIVGARRGQNVLQFVLGKVTPCGADIEHLLHGGQFAAIT